MILKLFTRLILITSISWALSASATTQPPLEIAVGQMMMVGMLGTQIDANSAIVQSMKKYHIGGVILLERETIDGQSAVRNILNPTQLLKLTQALQHYAKKNKDPLLLIAVNQEGGRINALVAKKGFKVGPNFSQSKLGHLNDLKLTQQQAQQRGELLKQYHINVDFAPVADLNINPKNPAVGALDRSYGKDITLVTQQLKAAITGYQQAGILCTLKHFPGLGSSTTNTDFALTEVTSTWSKTELLPYQNLIEQQQVCPLIMVTHLVNRDLDPQGLAASLSEPIVTGLLRDQLHFTGVVITDDMDAAAIRQAMPAEEAIKHAVLAGNDIILYGGVFGHDPTEDADMLYHTLLKLAQQDPKFREKVYDSYQRIIAMKKKLPSL